MAKFKSGEQIKIVKPEFFVRCGYPLTMEMVRKEIEEAHHAQIEEFLKSLGFERYTHAGEWPWGHCPDRHLGFTQAYEGVIRGLSSGLLNKRKFGGSARTIHTETIPELEGVTCWVSGIRYVKTGSYVAGNYSGPFHDGDYEPAHLEDEKTHRILMTSLVGNILDALWIEDCHVAKVDL